MFDFENLIGLEYDKALDILSQNGYNKTEIIINSKSNALCDSKLVVKAQMLGDKVILILGEFYLNLKG